MKASKEERRYKNQLYCNLRSTFNEAYRELYKLSDYDEFFEKLKVLDVKFLQEHKDLTVIEVTLSKPGLLIGKKGELIQTICDRLATILGVQKVKILVDEFDLTDMYWSMIHWEDEYFSGMSIPEY
jgi:ribosomal protein S3